MSVLARITVEAASGRRGSRRRRIRLDADCTDAATVDDIVLHDLSSGGCSFASRFAVPNGTRMSLRIPGIGAVGGRVAWSDAAQTGCAFDAPLDPSAIAAALAAAPVVWGDFPADPRAPVSTGDGLPAVSTTGKAWPVRFAPLWIGAGLLGFWTVLARLV